MMKRRLRYWAAVALLAVAAIITVPGVRNSSAQEQQFYKFLAEQSKPLKPLFNQYGFRPNWTKAAASLIVVAGEKFPTTELEELAKGKLIGMVYSPQSFPRYKLSNAPHALVVRRENGFWIADFLGPEGNLIHSEAAAVKKVSRFFEVPAAFVTNPGFLICWDNICVEI